MTNPILNFGLTVDETNLVLKSLGNMPYNEVANVITKIKSVGEAQWVASQQPQTAKVSEDVAESKPEQLNG